MISGTKHLLQSSFLVKFPRALAILDPPTAPWERQHNCLCAGMQSDRDPQTEQLDSDEGQSHITHSNAIGLSYTSSAVAVADVDPREGTASVAVLEDITVALPPEFSHTGRLTGDSTVRIAPRSHIDFTLPSPAAHDTGMFARTSHPSATGLESPSHAVMEMGIPPSAPMQTQGYYGQAGTSSQTTGTAATLLSRRQARSEQTQNPGRAHRFCHACHHINHVRRKKCTNCQAPKTVIKGSSWRPRVSRMRDNSSAVMRPVLPAHHRESAGSSTAMQPAYTIRKGMQEAFSRVGQSSAQPHMQSPVHPHRGRDTMTQEMKDLGDAIDDALDMQAKDDEAQYDQFP